VWAESSSNRFVWFSGQKFLRRPSFTDESENIGTHPCVFNEWTFHMFIIYVIYVCVCVCVFQHALLLYIVLGVPINFSFSFVKFFTGINL